MRSSSATGSASSKIKFLLIISFMYFVSMINLCTSSFQPLTQHHKYHSLDKNNHFISTTHHPLRHQRHYYAVALNRTESTTRSPIQSVRNFLSSREHDTKRHYYRASTTISPFIPITTIKPPAPSTTTTRNPFYYEKIPHKSGKTKTESGKTYRHVENYQHQKVKEKTFDEIIREISQFNKRKRFHKTTTTTTTSTTESPELEEDYIYDDEDFQDDEADSVSNTNDDSFLLPERHDSHQSYNSAKKVSRNKLFKNYVA